MRNTHFCRAEFLDEVNSRVASFAPRRSTRFRLSVWHKKKRGRGKEKRRRRKREEKKRGGKFRVAACTVQINITAITVFHFREFLSPVLFIYAGNSSDDNHVSSRECERSKEKKEKRKKKEMIFTFGGSLAVFNLGFGFSGFGVCIREKGRGRERVDGPLRESNKKRARVKLRGGRAKLIWTESLIKWRRITPSIVTQRDHAPCKIISSSSSFFPPFSSSVCLRLRGG